MAPIGYGILAMIAGVMVVAVLVGSAGGTIHGRVNGELSLGAILVAGAYFLVVVSLEPSSGRISVFGLFPLILTFLVGSLVTRFLERRLGLRPVFASLGALGSALLVGFSYLMLIRFGWLELTDRTTAWIALAIVSGLVLLSILNRMRNGPRRLPERRSR